MKNIVKEDWVVNISLNIEKKVIQQEIVMDAGNLHLELLNMDKREVFRINLKINSALDFLKAIENILEEIRKMVNDSENKE